LKKSENNVKRISEWRAKNAEKDELKNFTLSKEIEEL